MSEYFEGLCKTDITITETELTVESFSSSSWRNARPLSLSANQDMALALFISACSTTYDARSEFEYTVTICYSGVSEEPEDLHLDCKSATQTQRALHEEMSARIQRDRIIAHQF